jgi:hypothetical protein
MNKNELIKCAIRYVISNLDDDNLIDTLSEIAGTDDIGEIEDILQDLVTEDFD